MEQDLITGALYKKMLISGYNNLKNHADEVNDLNVFPIPDGDTGDNMCSTMYGGIKAITNIDGAPLNTIAQKISDGMLLGARGNSGVILSQMFAGINSVLAKYETANFSQLIEAYDAGVKSAYNSVSTPVEGTILTVIREANGLAKKKTQSTSSIHEYLVNYLVEAKTSLDNTPELLDVLKEAGVVDSGGAGIFYIMEGFLKAFEGEDVINETHDAPLTQKQIDFSLFNENSVMDFGYCTEFLLQLTSNKINVNQFSLDEFKEQISVFGNSIVAVKTGTIVKIHIHTLNPGQVLEFAQKYGEFLTLKIENMTLQHNEKIEKETQQVFKANKVRKKFAVVAVANGQGLIDTFKELGSDIVIDGGQGRNPSVEVFIKAFDAVNADTIFVLPNNNNILMAANEAKKKYTSSDVRVIPSSSLGEGYSVLSCLDYESKNADEIEENMTSAVKNNVSGMISKANRSTTIKGKEIVEGNYIGFVHKNIITTHKERLKTVKDLINHFLESNDKQFLIIFTGTNPNKNEIELLENFVETNYKDIEVYITNGGQEVYDYLIIAE